LIWALVEDDVLLTKLIEELPLDQLENAYPLLAVAVMGSPKPAA
jgi:hypothetical protein